MPADDERLLSGARSPVDAADLPRLDPGWLDPGWLDPGWLDPGWLDPGWPQPEASRGGPQWPRRTWVEHVMGMPVSITVRGPGLDARPGPQPVLDGVARAVAALHRVDAMFSTWKTDSQVSRLRRGEVTLAECDPQVGEVAALCERARTLTGGWFDADLPDVDGVRRFDPTGLVKGWAVQRCTDALSAALDEYDVLVNAGGDLAARCRRGDTPAWQLAIENPLDRARVIASVPIRVGGVATSGTAARGAHILSLRTGRPTAELASVTVIGPELLWADVWATAAFAEGPACVDRLRTLADHSWLVVALDGTVTTA